MKFGKVLETQAIDEWRNHYIQYKKLKRVIKRIVFEQQRHEIYPSTKALQRPSIDEASALLQTPRRFDIHEAPEEAEAEAKAEFWTLVEENLKTVNDFYQAHLFSIQASIRHFEKGYWDAQQSSSYHVHSSWSTTDGDSTVDRGFARLQELYNELVDLKAFGQLNETGFRKIVKKLDKACGSTLLPDFLTTTMATQPFEVLSTQIDPAIEALYRLTSRDALEAGNMDKKLRQMQHQNDRGVCPKVRTQASGIAVFLFLFILVVFPLCDVPLPDCQIKSLALLVFITSLWVTEALPYFATAILIPPLVVFLQILEQSPGVALPAKAAANEVMSHLVNHTTILIMGGYAISAAFVKCQIELYIASHLQQRFKHSPRLFLLAIMMMGLFLSCWISNHTAPVLCTSVLIPIIRDFPADSQYVKCLLIGLAFACNLGGMMTPIASLQNTLALSYLEKANYDVSFGQWMCIAVPFCSFSTVLCWLYLLKMLKPEDIRCIPQIVYDQTKPVDRVHLCVMTLTLVTIAMWATFSFWLSGTFGDLGIISMCLMVMLFGSGILNQYDFNSMSWHILFLIGGGNVLGDAIQKSGLLQTLGQFVILALPSTSVWLFTLCLCVLVLGLTTFVSHTVASIILLPIIVHLSLETSDSPSIIPVICCAFSISAAMGLPFSSFPNINSLMVKDDHGKPYLQVRDFVQVGILFSCITVGLIMTLGYSLIVLIT